LPHRRRFERAPIFGAEREGRNQQRQCLALRRAPITSLERANPLHADAGALRESLL
jgi:hypothetical protein